MIAKTILLGLWFAAASSGACAEPFPCSLMVSSELATLKAEQALVEARPRTIDADLELGITEPLQATECFVTSVVSGSGTTERSAIVVSEVLDQSTLMRVKQGLLRKRELAQNDPLDRTDAISMFQFNRDDVECVGALMPSLITAERANQSIALQFSVCRGLWGNRIVAVSTVDRNLLGAAVLPASALYRFDHAAKQIPEYSK